MKKNAAKRKKKKITNAIIATVTTILVLGLTGTILYTQFFKEEVDRFFEKKYTVTDVNGAQIEFTEDELAAEVNSDRFYQGIKVDGVDVGGKTLEEAKAMFNDTRDKKVDDMVDVQFQVGSELVKMKTDGMSLSSNIDDVLSEAFKYAKSSTLEGVEGLKDRYALITELKKTPKEYNSSFTIGYDNVSTLAHEALDSFNKEPVEAHATGFDVSTLSFIIDESANGQSVNVDKAIEDVNSSFEKAEYGVVIPVEVSVVEPQTSADYLRSHLGKVSSNSSKTKDDSNRNTNIRLVCEIIDGLVLQPGEQFDFNKRVGERTAERGFKEAGGIYDGRSRKELGGGICQANTMIYHSVVEADLQVDERNPHSWPSDYVDKGTDATVTWGGANFKFTNNTEYPVALHAYYGDLWVTVELYGRLLPDGQRIEFVGEEISREQPSGVEYIADPSMPVGSTSSDRSSHPHIVAKSYRIFYNADGQEIKREEYQTSDYRMIRASVHVGTRAPDGTIFHMDPATGEVTPPDGYVAPTPTPDPTDPSNSSETPPPSSEETPPPSSEETPPPSSEETPPPSSEETPPPSSEETPPPSSEETPPPSSEETPPPSSEETPPPSSEETPPPSSEETPPPSSEEETPPPESSEEPAE